MPGYFFGTNLAFLLLYKIMIRLYKNSSLDIVCLTLSEAISMPNPDYLFVFINDTTKEELIFIVPNADDYSLNKDRYNLFNFNTETRFINLPSGDYKYTVYEAPAGIDESILPVSSDSFYTGLLELENGKAQLIGDAKLFIENKINTSFIQNNG